jgi:CBS domain-containing protein
MSGRHGDSTVADVMTSTVHVARADLPLQRASRLMSENGVGAVPVVDGRGHVIGLLSEADLLLRTEDGGSRKRLDISRHRAPASEHLATMVGDAMSGPVATIVPTASVGEAARLMRRRHVRHLPVVDADGRLRGIVSRSDLLRVFLRHDRDIARQIVTEVLPRASWRDGEPGDVRVETGVVRMRGRLERRTEALLIERLAASVEGVVDVRSELMWEWDDLSRGGICAKTLRTGSHLRL